MRRYLRQKIFLLLLVPSVACSAAIDANTGSSWADADGGAVGVTSEDLTGRIQAVGGGAGDETCTPFALASYDRAATMASAVMWSPAFEACVRQRSAEYHISCSTDPFYTSSITAQVDYLLAALRNGNHMQVNCDPTDDMGVPIGDSAPNGALPSWGSDATGDHNAGFGWFLNHFDRESRPGVGFWEVNNFDSAPWNFHVMTQLHEFAHNHQYNHPEFDCSTWDTDGGGPNTPADNCTIFPGPEGCGWTTFCGGTGVPPDNTYNPTDPGSRNRCAFYAGLGDMGYVNNDSDPSFPYIIDSCAADLLEQSQDECGDIFSTACGVDEIRLRTQWSNSNDDFYGTCSCQASTRHQVAFQVGTGNYLQAWNAGGSTFSAAGTGVGSWQTMYLRDINGGALMSGDDIYIRTWASPAGAGYFVAAGATTGSEVTAAATSESARTRWRIYRQAGAGRVNTGDAIYLYNVDRARYMTAINNGGGVVVSDQTVPSTWERFFYREPRRALLVNIRAHDGNYVTFNPASSVELTTSPLAPEFDGSGNQQLEARQQSFWLVDHNGGALMNGDQVSFEHSLDPLSWSTCTSGTTGNVRGNANYASDPCQRFSIYRVGAGSGPIRHRESISIRSADLRYLNAFPAGFGATSFHLRNEATTVGPWEVFRLDYAQGRANPSCPSNASLHPYCNGVTPRFEVY